MPDMSPELLRLRARIAAEERWGREPDRSAATNPARSAFLARFEKEADPEGVLPPEERARRAQNLRRAYMYRLALKSARARQVRKAS